LAGGLLASTTEPGTFTILFVVSAGTSLAFASSLALVPEPTGVPRDASLRVGGYRRVLRDRYFLGTIGVNAIFVTAGVALLTTMLPVFAKTEAGLSEDVIGAIFLANTITIVLAQLPLTHVLEGRRRMPVLTLTGALWAACWVAILGAAEGPTAAAALAFIAVGIAFGLGECLDGVIQGPLVADLAPAELRGRYMALWLITAQAGFALGPALGGVLLAVSPAALWLPAAACCAVAGVAALALERGLPFEARRTPAAKLAHLGSPT
jgi:predicted MFS family arabinose efflux permease